MRTCTIVPYKKGFEVNFLSLEKRHQEIPRFETGVASVETYAYLDIQWGESRGGGRNLRGERERKKREEDVSLK